MKKKRTWKKLSMLLLMAILVLTMSLSAEAAAKLSKSKASLYPGNSITLNVSGTKSKVKWSSSNKKVAKVSSKGKVTAVKQGSTTIKAKVGKKTYKCKITVKAPALSQKKLSLTVNTSQTLKLNGTKIKSVSTSNKKIATVTKKGKVTAKKVGKCTITVKGANKKTYKCQVTVTAAQPKPTATPVPSTPTPTPVPSTPTPTPAQVTVAPSKAVVSTQAQLDKVMQDSGSELEQITIQTSGNDRFTIPESTRTSTELVIDAPNGEVENNAKFKQIVIQAIANNTYIENAVGNTILYEAPSGRITVSTGASANISICQKDSVTPTLDLVKNGTVSELKLETKANVSISGTSDTSSLAVTSTSAAGGSTISTSLNLKLTADSKVSLQLNPGAENTTAQVSDESVIPDVTGLGKVPVTDNNGTLVDTVMAENNGSVEAHSVTITGKIVTTDGSAKADVDVYFIKYAAEINSGNISNYLTAENKAAVTNADGTYSFDTVWGNYYLAAVSEGYLTELQTVEITSASGSSFSNGDIRLTSGNDQGTGIIELQLKDALTGEDVNYPLLLKIRSGSNNITGSALRTVSLTADDKGHCIISDLAAGTYTIQAITNADSDTKIMPVPFNVTVVSGSTEEKSFTVTRVLDDQQIRFVLTWGTETSGAPSDLDSHLVGPAVSGNNKFHTWYSSKEYYDNDTKYADLDVDDTTWEGPETTTIYSAVAGTYSFYIYDFTDQGDESSRNMSNKSSAVVNVYRGSQLLNTFYVPTGCSGNLWHVCDYDSTTGKVTSVNSVGYWPDGGSETVGLTDLEVLKSRLNEYIISLENRLDYLVDNTYKTETQNLLNQAKYVYTDSEDEDTVREMNTKVQERLSDLDSLSISVSYQGSSYYGYICDDSINIRGLENALGEIKVTPEYSSENYKVSVEDVTGQDYVKMITLTDATTGATKIWKVYYAYDITMVFQIQDVTGDGITNYYIDRYYDDDDNSVITVYKDRSTVSNLKFTVMDGVTYTIDASDNNNYDAVVNMKYLDNTYKYYVRYVNDSNIFGISDIYGDQIVRYDSYYDENDNEAFHIYGTAAALPDIDIDTYRTDAKADVIDSSVIRVTYNDIYKDYHISYTQLTSLELSKDRLNSKISSLEYKVDYLADNDYKTATQNLLNEAQSIYSNSEDENTVNEMISKINKCISDIEKLWIYVAYQGDTYSYGYSDNSISFSGLEATLGEIKVTTDSSSDNLNVSVEDVTDQDYVKLITLTDATTGASKTWKVYYSYDVTTAFKVLYIYGDGITGYSHPSTLPQDDIPVITIYKDRSTVSNLKFTVMDGVTYTIAASDNEDYDEVLNMSYLTYSYKYYIRYEYNSSCFEISGITGDGIIKTSCDYYDSSLNIYGTSAIQPEFSKINTYYDDATATIIDSSTVRVSYDGISKDYNVSYTQITPVELTLNTDYEFTLSSYRGSYASFTPDASGYYILSSASEGSNLYSYVYCDGSWYEYYNLSSKVYLNADTTYYFELHASNSDTATVVTLCMTKDSDTDSTADASAADAGISDEIFGDGTSDSTVESAETVETQDAENFTVEEDVDPAEDETSVEIADDETEDAAASDESSEVSIEDFSE